MYFDVNVQKKLCMCIN